MAGNTQISILCPAERSNCGEVTIRKTCCGDVSDGSLRHGASLTFSSSCHSTMSSPLPRQLKRQSTSQKILLGPMSRRPSSDSRFDWKMTEIRLASQYL